MGSSGLEPPTSRLSGARSNQLSYEPKGYAAFLKESLAKNFIMGQFSVHSPEVPASLTRLLEMRGFEPLTPCLQGRCSPN